MPRTDAETFTDQSLRGTGTEPLLALSDNGRKEMLRVRGMPGTRFARSAPMHKPSTERKAAAARPRGAPHLLDASMFWVATGGVHRVLATKHDRLREMGWRHTLMAPGAQGPGNIDCGGLALPASGGYRVVLRRGPLERLIETARPDIVEAADPYVPAWAVLSATERLRVPAVAFCHSNLPAIVARLAGGHQGGATLHGRWAARQARAYLVRLYAHFDLVMAPSDGLTRLLRHWGVLRAVHQPLGVDSSVFHPAANDPAWRHELCRRLGLPARTKLLVYTGRFATEKNLQLLADAVDLLGPGHALLLVGSGPRPPTGRRVFVLPPETDSEKLARLVASCDAYVHAGDIETFGLGVLEAMGCGTPVVVNAAAGHGELVRHAGLCVERQRPQEWAEAMHSSLCGESTRETFLALQRARQYDWSWIMEQLTRRYARLLSGDRAQQGTAASRLSAPHELAGREAMAGPP